MDDDTDNPLDKLPAVAVKMAKVVQSVQLTSALRDNVAKLIGQPVEKMGDAQWIGHILKRLHLLDEAGRKRSMDGIAYTVKPSGVIDMMRRYDVAVIHETR